MGFEDMPKQPGADELAAKRAAMAKMADSAVKSDNRVVFENQLSIMASDLASVSGNDWAEFRSLVSGLDMTDEEARAVEEVVPMLQSMRPEFSEERRRVTLESFARRSKIIDVAIALKSFDRLPRATTEGKIGSIRNATTRLMEALSTLSSEQDTKEAVEHRGLIISKDETQEVIERGKNIKIV